jgi:hypothetical protein
VLTARKSCFLGQINVSKQIMSNGEGRYEIFLLVTGRVDDEELDRERIYLQNELKELEGVVEIGQISPGEVPEGARAIDLVVVGAVALALRQAGVFHGVENVVKEWIKRGEQHRERRKVVIKSPNGASEEYTGYSPGEVRKMRLNPGIKTDTG